MDYENHPTFCLYPWTHRTIDTNGDIKLCCRDQGKPKGHVSNMGTDWNGDTARQVRRDLTDGKKIKSCNDCWAQEALGKESHRQSYNRRWINRPGVKGVVERSLEADMFVDVPPMYIEVRFGNLCNLTCKMCVGHSSTQVFKDAAALKKLDPEGYHEFIPHEEDFLDQNFQWHEDAFAWDQIDQIIPHLRQVTITGGEPTLIKRNMEFLERIIELGYAPVMDVDITTNLTNINDKFLDLMSKFKNFHVSFSIDGVGDHYEYIRFPANWDKIEENMRKVLARTHDCDTIRVGVHMVIQIYNVLYIPDILDRLISIFEEDCAVFPGDVTSVAMTPIYHPFLFNLSGAPDIVKAVAVQRLEHWLENHSHDPEKMKIFPAGTFEMILSQLHMDQEPDRAKKVLDYSRFLDQNKRVNLQQKIPELARLLEVARG